MCVFIGEVDRVSATSIFSRMLGERQLVVYSMTYAGNPRAMVLPVPATPGSPEAALRFISLENCPKFFAEMRSGFPAEVAIGATMGSLRLDEATTLKVHTIGAYEASFVPRPEDFGRLNERFRLSAELWLTLNHYRDWGFAVFKLRDASAATEVHPMAFTFPTRDPARLFFPTLHMHHGQLERSAAFDHTLYCQPAPAMNWHLQEWRDSRGPAGGFMHCKAARELLAAEYPCWRVDVAGSRENRDTWLGKGERIPALA